MTWMDGALLAGALLMLVAGAAIAQEPDPLPSWKPGPTRTALLAYVRSVTTEGSPQFVPPGERIAVFDNDGTLWAENPIYVQAQFALDRIRAMAPEHPEWRERQPFKAVLEGDRETLARMSEHDAAALMAVTHSGMTTTEFDQVVREWIASARHPRFQRLYRDCAYQPMLEVLAFLRANGFTPFIVSGGGVDFMRVFAQEVYGVPPAQVIGSSGKTRFVVHDGKAVLDKLPELASLDDQQGKPINIQLHIGQRPILAFGNSDGDLQMLQYTTLGGTPGMAVLIHHDDAEREYAYDRQSKIGRLAAALDAAEANGWTVVSMKSDWAAIFPPSPAP